MMGNLDYFLNELDAIIKTLAKNSPWDSDFSKNTKCLLAIIAYFQLLNLNPNLTKYGKPIANVPGLNSKTLKELNTYKTEIEVKIQQFIEGPIPSADVILVRQHKEVVREYYQTRLRGRINDEDDREIKTQFHTAFREQLDTNPTPKVGPAPAATVHPAPPRPKPTTQAETNATYQEILNELIPLTESLLNIKANMNDYVLPSQLTQYFDELLAAFFHSVKCHQLIKELEKLDPCTDEALKDKYLRTIATAGKYIRDNFHLSRGFEELAEHIKNTHEEEKFQRWFNAQPGKGYFNEVYFATYGEYLFRPIPVAPVPKAPAGPDPAAVPKAPPGGPAPKAPAPKLPVHAARPIPDPAAINLVTKPFNQDYVDLIDLALRPYPSDRSDAPNRREYTFNDKPGMSLTIVPSQGRIVSNSNDEDMLERVVTAAQALARKDPTLVFSVSDGTDAVKNKVKQLMYERGLNIEGGYTPPPPASSPKAGP